MRKLIFIILCVISSQSFGTTYAVGVVTKIKSFTSVPGRYNTQDLGMIFIYLDELEGACDSDFNRVAIGINHPLAQSVLSIAMMSKATKTKISLGHLNSCYVKDNAWDFSVIELLE